jgi:hypothetical protein
LGHWPAEKTGSETRVRQGYCTLSTGVSLHFDGCGQKGEQNTRYSSFLLTYTIDSGIFSSAAVKRIVIRLK